MIFKPSKQLMKKAQGYMSKGRFVKSIDLQVPDEPEFKTGDARCRVIFLDTNTGEEGCLYMKLNPQTHGVSNDN